MVKTMLELVEYMVKALVDHPEAVVVKQTAEDEDSVTIELSVAQEDMGKVIGKQGRIAKAIRTVVRAASAKDKKKYMVEIVE